MNCTALKIKPMGRGMSKKWDKVGAFLKENATSGAALVGSILTGNLPGAVAAGVSIVAQATGTDNPDDVLAQLQGNPQAVVRVRELALERDKEINRHIEAMALAEMEDEQAQHRESQATIRAGDVAEDKFVRWTRPGQSWLSLFAAISYAGFADSVDVLVLSALLTLPFTYAGLRQFSKWKDADMLGRIAGVAKK